MKNLRWWSVIGVAAMGATLAGCGKSDSSGNVSLRIANATLTHPSIDLLINAVVSVPAVAADAVSGYVTPGSGANTLQIDNAGSSTSLYAAAPTLTSGAHYTLLAYESGGAVKAVTLGEDLVVPPAGAVTLRIYDAAIEAGKLDVYLIPDATTTTGSTSPCHSLTGVAPTTSFGTLTAPAASASTAGPGTYRVCVTAGGNNVDLRLDMPGVTFISQQVATVILTPAAGGLLINGSTLIQQGAYSAVRNTSTRVRLAAAVASNANVDASASTGETISAGSVAPAFGTYALVPASSTLTIHVNGQSIGAPATALVPGGDMTLLVYGPAVGATASLLVDDNRPPSDPTTVKLRLINGITGAAGALSLSANSVSVASAIAPGQGSTGYVSVGVISGTTTQLTLQASNHAGDLLSQSATLLPNTVYTVMGAGDASAPQMLIR